LCFRLSGSVPLQRSQYGVDFGNEIRPFSVLFLRYLRNDFPIDSVLGCLISQLYELAIRARRQIHLKTIPLENLGLVRRHPFRTPLQPQHPFHGSHFPSSCLSLPSNAFFRGTIEKTYKQDPPLSLHLKIFLFKFFCCL
jgi:hypothetical protein